MPESITLDQLRLFLCVAEVGSFSAAGRKLGRVQSAVGYGISNLEENLGMPLFVRTGSKRALTEAGRALLPDIEGVFSQIARVRERASHWSTGVEASLALAIEAMVPGELVVDLCRSLRREFPSVSLRVRTEGLGGVASVVLDGTCVIGISGDYDVEKRELRARLLATLPVVAVAAATHELARQTGPIPKVALRGTTQVSIAHVRYGSGSDNGLLSDQDVRTADPATKLALIEAGVGWGFVPAKRVEQALKAGSLVALHFEDRVPGPQSLPIYLITRRGVQLGPAAQWLIRELSALFERSPLFEPVSASL